MKEAEDRCSDELQLFRVLMENLPGPVYYKDVNGVYLGYNRAFRNYFGFGNGDYVGKTVFDLPISREEAALHHEADKELIRSRGHKVYRSSATYPDGSIRYSISKKATFMKPDGTLGGIVGFVTDITELKRAEEALRVSETRFRDLSEASLEVVSFVEKGIIVDVNHRMQEMFGYGDNEIIGREILSLIIPEAQNEVKRRMASRNQEKCETMGLKKDGTVFPIEIHMRDLHLRGKHVRISIIRDLTEQKSMEDEILKAKNLQSVGTLAGGIAHDFNNLLMAIVGNISLARMNTAGDGKANEFLDEAERIAFMGKNLTHQLLTFSRGGDPVRRIIVIGDILRDVTERTIGSSPIKLEFSIAEDIFPVEVDEDQIRQVFQNVIMNAKEAMPSGGSLVITCENVSVTPEDKLPLIKEDYVRISIRDEGTGIPEAAMTKIFDPYFTTKGMGAQKGVGLGLAICYSIVKKHNGYITAESAPDKGTTFQVYLPAYKKEAMDMREEATAAVHGKGRILVMDDEEMILKIARELLQYLGYEVTTARNGEEAIDFYRQAMELKRTFDGIILDLAVPGGLGGKEVMKELVAIDPQAKVIISSGYLNDPIIQDYRSYGFSSILTKPYDAKELDEKLQAIITPRR